MITDQTIKDLQDAAQQIVSKATHLVSQISEIIELLKQNTDVVKIQIDRHNDDNNSHASIQKSISTQSTSIADTEKKITTINNEIDEIDTVLESLNQEIVKAKTNINSLNENVTDIFGRIDTVRETFREAKTFYVNQSTGSNTISKNIGESESKPFAAIQPCVDYILANYDQGKYDLTIKVAPGNYQGRLVLQTMPGAGISRCILTSLDKTNKAIITAPSSGTYQSVNICGGVWTLDNLKFNITSSTIDSCLMVDGTRRFTSVNYNGLDIIFNQTSGNTTANYRVINVLYGATLTFQTTDQTTITVNSASSNMAILDANRRATIFLGRATGKDILVKSTNPIINVRATYGSLVGFVDSANSLYQKFAPQSGYTPSGKRFVCSDNSFISSGGNGINNIYIGSEDGDVDSSSQVI